MKKLFIYVFCYFLIISCVEKTITSSQTTYKTLINKTNKDLYYEVQTDTGVKNMFVNRLDSSTISFFRKNEDTKIIIGGTVRLDQIMINKELIYNLTDTTLFEYKLEYSSSPQIGNNLNEQIYSRHLSYEYDDKSTDINSIIFIKLHVTDSILNVMHKDYSMLEKFKEYYLK
jgi:hypothetical protein